MWQVSGNHGVINRDEAIESMLIHSKSGLFTWDLADHYGPAEDFVKVFRETLKEKEENDLLKKIKFFTKWVPRPQKITDEKVRAAVDVSCKRMGMDSLDMLQFHWWDYRNKEYLKAMEYLDDLREEGLIKHLGLTNFDSKHVQEFVDMGIKIVSNQVQYSIIDTRPESLMQDICEKNNIKLLVYGTLGGGLLTKRFLNKSKPNASQLNTASLYKYYNMVQRWGDWNLFTELLNVLQMIAEKHKVSIANVAVRYTLENPIVAAAIVGVRLGISEHIQENMNIFDFSLDKEDLDMINRVNSRSNNLIRIIGDCGDEYR
ncbi:MAG: aldo/keto reductase [Candidatus Lokiarchaeota archaeon]|nr:aldo/keto reductase [Candidatus Lokiarchaeota archaeon]MBD3201424.1 aldo/keto reductase [Candidatus Lokiarchaeota archaeon]